MESFGPQMPIAQWADAEKHREPGETFTQKCGRVAGALSDFPEHYDKFNYALKHQLFLPGGRIQSSAGSVRKTTAFNCLSGDTPILTKEYGRVNIEDVALQNVHVKDGKGNWVLSPVNSFGKREVRNVKLSGGYNNTRKYSVKATDNHRWILEDGGEVVTDQLSPGHTLLWVKEKPVPYSKDYKEGVQHGIIYGDGTKTHNRYSVRLCGDKVQLAGYLEDWSVSYPPSSNGDPHFFGSNDREMKELPDTSIETVDYLKGFLRGWMATDGHVCKRDNKALISCGPEQKDWLEKYGPVAGFEVSYASELTNETNFGKRNYPVFNCSLNSYLLSKEDFLMPHHKENFKERTMSWRVDSVEKTGEIVDVYCPRVVTTDSVQLLSGVHTGQCYVMRDVPDDFDGIMDVLKEAGQTLRMGGGVGYNFSDIRPKGDNIKSLQSSASGPVSFMDMYNSMCGTIMSAGHRRGAQMATLRVDHPDIVEFVTSKTNINRLTNFNISVLVTDKFMEAVRDDKPFDLVFNNRVYDTVRAVNLWETILRNTWDWAEPGVIFIDRVNQMNNLYYLEDIRATNPCVSGDTPVLTDKGWKEIQSLVGQKVNVWNGFQFSEVLPKVTGHDRDMVTVYLSDGSEIRCTTNHKFIVDDGSRVEAAFLQVGQKLQKSDWPVISGDEKLQVDYYAQGFFSGDGWVKQTTGGQYIGLYGDKKNIPHQWNETSRHTYAIAGGYQNTDTSQTKEYLFFPKGTFQPKDFVPFNAPIEQKREWLAGLSDADGTILRDGSVQITAKDRNFLLAVKALLNTMGANGNLSAMKDCWRVSISASYMQTLNVPTKRLSQIVPSRDARRFLKITGVVPSGKENTVYCFTEQLNHSGVFNGVYTGQCGEQPLPPYGACLLGSINLPQFIENDHHWGRSFNFQKLWHYLPYIVRAMDNVIDETIYPLEEQELEAKQKRRMGIGITGLANTLGTLGIEYGSQASLDWLSYLHRNLTNNLYRCSISLAHEKGSFPLFDRDKYLQGKFVSRLDADVQQGIAQIGIRNSHLTSIAPTGTISLGANNVSSGIEPVYSHEYERKVTQPDGSVSTENIQDYALWKWGIRCKTADEVTVQEHVDMLCTAQEWVDSAVSKTCNVGSNVTWDQFKDIYMQAYDGGAKGCTTFRASGKRAGILSASATEDVVEEEVKEDETVVEGSACFIDVETGIRSCE